jgi:hypothetical protein
MQVEVVDIEAAGYYWSKYANGNTVKVTLQRGKDFASCDGMLIWEEELAEEAFDEWLECAVAGEEGYSAMLFENGSYTFYGAE